MIKEKKYILLSLHKSGEYITTEVCCLYHSTSHNFIYSTLCFLLSKEKGSCWNTCLSSWVSQQSDIQEVLAAK